MEEVGIVVGPVCRPGAAIGVAVGGGLVVRASHFPLSPLLLLPPRLQLIRLMTTLLLVLILPSSAPLILLMDCLKVGAIILIVAELVAVVVIYAAEVPPRRLYCDAASRDTS